MHSCGLFHILRVKVASCGRISSIVDKLVSFVDSESRWMKYYLQRCSNFWVPFTNNYTHSCFIREGRRTRILFSGGIFYVLGVGLVSFGQICFIVDIKVSFERICILDRFCILVDEILSSRTIFFFFSLSTLANLFLHGIFYLSKNHVFFLWFFNVFLDHDCHCFFRPMYIHSYFSGVQMEINITPPGKINFTQHLHKG